MQDTGDPHVNHVPNQFEAALSQAKVNSWKGNHDSPYARRIVPSDSHDISETALSDVFADIVPAAPDAGTAPVSRVSPEPLDLELFLQTATLDNTGTPANVSGPFEQSTKRLRASTPDNARSAVELRSLTSSFHASQKMACPFHQTNPGRCVITRQHCEGQDHSGFENWSRTREHIKRNHLVVESPCSQCGHSSWKHNSAKKEPEAARANRKEGRGKRKRAVGTQKSHFSPPCTHPSHDYDRRDWISQTDADRIFSKMDTSIKPSTTTSLERQKWATFYMEINAGTNPDDVPSHFFQPRRQGFSLEQLLVKQNEVFLSHLDGRDVLPKDMVMKAFSESQKVLCLQATSASTLLTQTWASVPDTATREQANPMAPGDAMGHPQLASSVLSGSSEFGNGSGLEPSWLGFPGGLTPSEALSYDADSAGGFGPAIFSTGPSQVSSSGLTGLTNFDPEPHMRGPLNDANDEAKYGY